MKRIGEMKAGKAMHDLLEASPEEFRRYFDHVRNLKFEEEPDYQHLRDIFRSRMGKECWAYDNKFDWLGGSESGTLIPEEYRFDESLLLPPEILYDLW